MGYPRFVSHKEVNAAKIAEVEKASDGGVVLTLEGDYPQVRFSHEDMKRKPQPELGWYLVQYENGYVSFSPAKAFEEGYTLLPAEAQTYLEWKHGATVLTLKRDYPQVLFSHEEIKHEPEPEVGWYMVQYEEGHLSFSPAKAFEEGYALLPGETKTYLEWWDEGFVGDDDPYGLREYTEQSAAVTKEPVTENPGTETHEQ